MSISFYLRLYQISKYGHHKSGDRYGIQTFLSWRTVPRTIAPQEILLTLEILDRGELLLNNFPKDNYPEQLPLISSPLEIVASLKIFPDGFSPQTFFSKFIPLDIYHTFSQWFCCWLWAFKCRIVITLDASLESINLFEVNNKHTIAKSCKLEESFSQHRVLNNINFY